MSHTKEVLGPSVLASKVKTTKIEKHKLCIILEVLNEVSVEFPETKQFTDEHLEQKYLKENTSVEGVTFFR